MCMSAASDPRDDRSLVAAVADGRYRHVGQERVGPELVAPSLEDAYLLMRGTTTDEVEVRT